MVPSEAGEALTGTSDWITRAMAVARAVCRASISPLTCRAVRLTTIANHSCCAHAEGREAWSVNTSAGVLAYCRQTLIDVVATGRPRVTKVAVAGERAGANHVGAVAVIAGIRAAIIDDISTHRAGVSGRAGARAIHSATHTCMLTLAGIEAVHAPAA